MTYKCGTYNWVIKLDIRPTLHSGVENLASVQTPVAFESLST